MVDESKVSQAQGAEHKPSSAKPDTSKPDAKLPDANQQGGKKKDEARLAETTRPAAHSATQRPKTEQARQSPASSKDAAPKVDAGADTGADPQTRKSGTGAIAMACLSLVVAVVALAAAYWLYQQNEQLAAEIQAVDAAARTRFDTLESHAAIESVNERTRLLAERIAARFSQIDNSIEKNSEAVRAAAQNKIGDERGWRLAEIDYVMRIAAHRLMLLQDVEGAIAALKTADAQLHALSSPLFLPLRSSLDADMRALQAVDRPDLAGIAIRLDAIRDSVYELPVRTLEQPLAPDEQAQPLTAGFWSALQKLVVIKRNQQPVRSPPIAYAPRHHERTVTAALRAAQSAALRSDTEEYRRLLMTAAKTLDGHFNTEDESVRDTLKELAELSTQPLVVDLPDITGSLRLLEEARAIEQQTTEDAAS